MSLSMFSERFEGEGKTHLECDRHNHPVGWCSSLGLKKETVESQHHLSSLSSWLRNLCAWLPQAPMAAPPTIMDCCSPNWGPECFLWFSFVITTKLIHSYIIQILYTDNPYIKYLCKFKWKIVIKNCSFFSPLHIQLDRSARFGVQCVQCTLSSNREALLGCIHTYILIQVTGIH